jgi:hypothetical protein
MVALTAHTGGDIGDSHSWRAGLSVLNAKATDQLLVASNGSGDPVTDAFNGSTRVWVADAVWKWAPNGNATPNQLQAAGRVSAEHTQRRRSSTTSAMRTRQQLSRGAIGLVRAGRLQVPSLLADRTAHRAARSGNA